MQIAPLSIRPQTASGPRVASTTPRQLRKRPATARSASSHTCYRLYSRFFRDEAVFDHLADEVLYSIVKRKIVQDDSSNIKCLSIGCSTGEEVYSLRMSWLYHYRRISPHFGERYQHIDLEIDGFDSNAECVRAAIEARYMGKESCFVKWAQQFFVAEEDSGALRSEDKHGYFAPGAETADRCAMDTWYSHDADAPSPPCSVRAMVRSQVQFRVGDATDEATWDATARSSTNSGGGDSGGDAGDKSGGHESNGSEPRLYDVVLCRYSVFLYADSTEAVAVLRRIVQRLRPQGYLIAGVSDNVPFQECGLVECGCKGVFRLAAGVWACGV